MLVAVKRRLSLFLTKLFDACYGVLCSGKVGNINRALIVPPHGFGSVGDEAMLISVLSEVLDKKGMVCDVISFEKEGGWNRRLRGCKGFYQEIVLRGRFGDPFNYYTILRTALCYKSIYVVGADIMDGKYSFLQSCKRFLIMKRAASYGVDVQLIGSSFNTNMHPLVVKYIENSDGFVIKARDRRSYERVRRITPRAMEVVDSAFMLAPKRLDSPLTTFVESRSCISININSVHFNLYGEELINRLARDIEWAVSELNMNVVLVPHDVREEAFDAPSDLSLCRLLLANVNADVNEHVRVLDGDNLINARYIKWIAANSCVVVSGRMHFCIAALGSGVPVIAMAYQDKFEGLLEEFNLKPEKYILADYPANSDELREKLMFVMDDIGQRALIKENSTRIKERARLNV